MSALTTGQSIGTVVAVVAIILLSITIFRRPIAMLLRLLLNTISGFFFLLILNFFGQFIGVYLDVSWFNAIVVGIFGVPGVGFLLILQFIL